MSAPATSRLTRRGIPVDPRLRVLALGTFVNRAGAGATLTTFALYFTRVVGLAPGQVGLALSIAAIVGMLAQVPLGHLGDTHGPREVMSVLTAAFGAVGLLFLVVRSFWGLVLVLAAVTALQNGGGAVRGGYIGRIAVGGSGVAFKAYLRAVTNLAMSLGAALGGVALWIDRPWAYLAVFALDGVTGILAGLVSLRLPHLLPTPARALGEPRLAVLRDTPYVVVTLLTGVVAMHFVVMEVGIPLWISEHTAAPTAMVAALLVLNTVAVTLFQVRMTRGVDGVAESSRALVHGALWIAGAFAVIATSGWLGPVGAAVVLVVGAAIHVVGEMRSSGGQWGVQMGLAPQERQGQYQGFAGLGFSLSNVVAPTLITVLCIEWGWPGWLVLGAIVLAAALALQPATAWAQRTRERYGAVSATG
ncbi:MFS transporter [Pedococcus sp. KACC 23699]|uniref:MFS transporter n=1 Tax=Pedococcus sp. KACC 23699 TaxID=3149228 RepID=A0AAU7JT47_9MICO